MDENQELLCQQITISRCIQQPIAEDALEKPENVRKYFLAN